VIIYFCSPYAGQGETDLDRIADRERNVEFAEECCRTLSLIRGVTVFAPHLHYPRFLNDADEYERTRGIESGLTIMRVSAEVWSRLPSWRAQHSRGMRSEHLSAEGMAKPLHVFDHDDARWEAELRRLAIDAAAFAP
jgi:hypothetical protein